MPRKANIINRRSLNLVSKAEAVSCAWILDRYAGRARVKIENQVHALQRDIPDLVACCNGRCFIYFSKKDESKKARQLQGTLSRVLANIIQGIAVGAEVKLRLNGVGYKAKVEQQELILDVGFSHSVNIPIPPDITASLPDPTSITLSATNKEKLGAFAAKLRQIRPPEPYKGKGIQYVTETVSLKSGKSKR